MLLSSRLPRTLQQTSVTAGAFAVAALALAWLAVPLYPTAYAQMPATESVSLPAGSVFEITAETDRADAAFSWVLLQEKTLLLANRNRTMQYRFTAPGTYTLNAETASTDRSQIHRIIVTIQVTPPAGPLLLPEQSASAQEHAIVDADPLQLQSGKIILEPGRSIVRFTPVRKDIKTIGIDFDVLADANGDGDTRNDNAVGDSALERAEGSLFVWFAPVPIPRSFVVGGMLMGGTTVYQQLRLTDASEKPVPVQPSVQAPQTMQPGMADSAQSTPQDSTRHTIVSEAITEQERRFSVSFEDKAEMDVPLLYQWDFGDGMQSLLDHPLHTFARAGVYAVRVRIIDLRTQEEIALVQEPISVQTPPTAPTNPPAERNGASDGGGRAGRAEGGGSSVRGFLVLALKVLGVLLMTAATGAGAMFLLNKFRKKSLEGAIAAAENKLIGDRSQRDDRAAPPERTPRSVRAGAAPEPMPLDDGRPSRPEDDAPPLPIMAEDIREPPSPEEALSASLPEEEPSDTPPPQEATEFTEAPAWLQSGLEQSPSASPLLSSIPPTPPANEPEPEQTAAPYETKKNAGVPPPQPAAPRGPQSDVPAVNVAHTAMEPNAAALTADTTKAPAWLRGGLKQAEAKGQTAAAPPPSALAADATQADAVPISEPPPPKTDVAAPPAEMPPASPPSQPKSANPPPHQSSAGADSVAGQAATPPPDDRLTDAQAARDERERLRKKEKRQRYRENLKKRRTAEWTGPATTTRTKPAAETPTGAPEEAAAARLADDEPVAFVQAESITPPSAPPKANPKPGHPVGNEAETR